MVQIINITEARSNLSKLIKKVKQTKKPVIIIQDSSPSAVLYPYEELTKRDNEKEELFKLRFEKIFNEGENAFKKYLKKTKIKKPKTEDEAYTIIKNA